MKSKFQSVILDSKFYHDAFTDNYDRQRFKTENLYQLYAYIMNRQKLPTDHRGPLAGWTLSL